MANGNTIPIAGHGNVNLNLSLPMQHVLHVPNLSNNLISVHKLTKDLNCCVVFFPNKYELQALDTGKKIGLGEE